MKFVSTSTFTKSTDGNSVTMDSKIGSTMERLLHQHHRPVKWMMTMFCGENEGRRGGCQCGKKYIRHTMLTFSCVVFRNWSVVKLDQSLMRVTNMQSSSE